MKPAQGKKNMPANTNYTNTIFSPMLYEESDHQPTLIGAGGATHDARSKEYASAAVSMS